MSSLYPITANTDRHYFLYGSFIIEESIDGWQWAHEKEPEASEAFQTVFEAIEAANAWLEAQEAAHG